jgi:transcriptional regulator with XRE-family HTH domain
MTNAAEQLGQTAMSHMAKARELHVVGDPEAADNEARLAISQMRASARARLAPAPSSPIGGTMDTIIEAAPAETYGAYLARLREAAGFIERTDLARAIGGESAVKRLGPLLRRYEVTGAFPRLATIKLMAPALGVSVKDLDPKRFTPGAKPKRRKALPASATPPTKASAAPAGAFLRGIQIEPAGEGLVLVRFEAVLPTKGSQELIGRLLQSAALAASS